MERSVALKKLTKLLRKSFRYQVDLRAPNADRRTEALEKLKVADNLHSSVSHQLSARKEVLLKADPEYQRLVAAYSTTKENCTELRFISMSYRFTVFVSNGFLDCVEARGDSWEDIIDELKKKRAA